MTYLEKLGLAMIITVAPALVNTENETTMIVLDIALLVGWALFCFGGKREQTP